MEIVYKQFDINDSLFLFCAEDFEVYRISLTDDVEKTIEELKEKKKLEICKKKEKSNSYMDNKLKGFISDKDFITTIGLDISNGCTLNCTYCYITASKKNHVYKLKNSFLMC